jgi:EF-P beta-lysylation protein EpmB
MTLKPLLWREIQRENFTCIRKLSDFLELDEKQRASIIERKDFPLNLPIRLADKIQKKNLDDPILRQFLPLQEELEPRRQFTQDPVGDGHAAVSPKYLKKYFGRALLLTTGACAMHCRFCFRQKYEYASHQTGFSKELEFIRQDVTLKEIILSGGDPLSLSNPLLKNLITHLETIPHLKRLRFHTRFPIGIPERVDEELLEILKNSRFQIWFVIHCNHAQELDGDVLAKLKCLQKLGIPVLNQWVLLKGINDTLEILQQLCERLIDHGIFPYYLHQLDRTEGTAHFEIPHDQGVALIEELNKRLAGYGIPKYVQEQPGHSSKTPLFLSPAAT